MSIQILQNQTKYFQQNYPKIVESYIHRDVTFSYLSFRTFCIFHFVCHLKNRSVGIAILKKAYVHGQIKKGFKSDVKIFFSKFCFVKIDIIKQFFSRYFVPQISINIAKFIHTKTNCIVCFFYEQSFTKKHFVGLLRVY